ncbi:hypothetical protein ACWAG0_000158 [Enterobacter hormaechei]
MTIFGGKLAAVSWSDALEEKAFSVQQCLPSSNDTVLLFDSNGEGWLIGWRSMWISAMPTRSSELRMITPS